MSRLFRYLYSSFFTLYSSLLLLTACSSGDDKVSIEGRLLHMNQATFYVYSTDGVIDGIDTITVAGGRFEYEREIRHGGTLLIVFPNFSQIPIFVEPGTSVSIDGDAARLREVKVRGDELNENFTGFREMHRDKSVKMMRLVTEDFIGSDNCNTEVALWLIQQYFLTPKDADVKGAVAMLNKLAQKGDKKVKVKRLLNQLNATGIVANGDRIGKFSATDIDGRRITEKTVGEGKWVVMTCASWSYDSQSMLRRLVQRQDERVIAICLDVKKQEARDLRSRCGAEGVFMVCDSTQWENPLLRTFGLTTIPDNVMTENGKVVKRKIPISDL